MAFTDLLLLHVGVNVSEHNNCVHDTRVRAKVCVALNPTHVIPKSIACMSTQVQNRLLECTITDAHVKYEPVSAVHGHI